MKFLKRHPVVFALLLLIGTPAGLNYSGFCMAEGRWLSEEEKIRLVADYHNNRQTLPIGAENFVQRKYQNVDEFLKQNPDCCKVNPGGPYDLPPPSFLDRVTGFNSGDAVETEFIAFYYDAGNNLKSHQLKYHNSLTNCGKIKY